MKPRQYLGYVTYEGPSMIDGAPIISAITGFGARGSHNPKTGPMLQQWILRADQTPGEAIRSGDDQSICGTTACPFRKGPDGRICYVNPMGPASVYRSWLDGNYGDLGELPAVFDRAIRFGAYGDPGALPIDHIRELASRASVHGHTGYTHQWRSRRVRGLSEYLMASVEDATDQRIAVAAGWRTFRVAPPGVKGEGEIICPASEEAGKRTTCNKCGLCDGSRGDGDVRRSIVIGVHGNGKGAYLAPGLGGM
jgi:hypothetical protein